MSVERFDDELVAFLHLTFLDWEAMKLLRLMGDNGRPNDNMLMHILSPCAGDWSA